MNKQQVIHIMTSLGSSEDVACCARLLDYLESKSKRIYYYSDFVEAVAELELSDPLQVVQRSLNIFKSKKIDLIRQEYRYLDDDGVVYPVSVDDLQAAYSDGSLFLEWRNVADPGFATKVYIVFLAGSGGAV
ncbi:hypothetical protein [Pseudomonas donghuensis]|uniref:hypothetical protein n=1 Tax=Pseudomonas donghuensis TaxID=1163398 RepID=UPI0021602D94|nr:hypothetical protein [Pseudomonas donghuensis]UVL22768.1 hypothetical protein LOY30_18190 [Pseudomonas donghuensis]